MPPRRSEPGIALLCIPSPMDNVPGGPASCGPLFARKSRNPKQITNDELAPPRSTTSYGWIRSAHGKSQLPCRRHRRASPPPALHAAYRVVFATRQLPGGSRISSGLADGAPAPTFPATATKLQRGWGCRGGRPLRPPGGLPPGVHLRARHGRTSDPARPRPRTALASARETFSRILGLGRPRHRDPSFGRRCRERWC